MRPKKQTILLSSSDLFFDDCPICQAMKKAEEERRDLKMSQVEEVLDEVAKSGKGVVWSKNKNSDSDE